MCYSLAVANAPIKFMSYIIGLLYSLGIVSRNQATGEEWGGVFECRAIVCGFYKIRNNKEQKAIPYHMQQWETHGSSSLIKSLAVWRIARNRGLIQSGALQQQKY